MGRVSGFNNRFNAGELSEDAWSDSDLQQHAHGCALGLNMIGLIPGPMARRGGFWDAGPIKDETAAGWLIPFVRSRADSLMLEFGDEVVRVWRSDYTPLLDGPDQVEFSSPYATADLAGLRPRQSGDVLYLHHVDGLRPRTLVRTSNTSWAFHEIDYVNGPWRPENLTATTITPSGTVTEGGSVTLSASAAVFDPGMVGGLFRLRAKAGSTDCQAWGPSYDDPTAAFGAGTKCQSNGRVYGWVSTFEGKASNTEKMGTNPPIHDKGTVFDGLIWWQYLHDGGGVVEITGYSSATSVSGIVRKTLPMASGVATPDWSEGAYSDYRGWPTALPEIREERLFGGATLSSPDVLDASRTAGYKPTELDMTPGLGTGRVVDDDAVRTFAGAAGGRLVSLVSANYLLGLTTESELIIGGATLDDPVSPASVLVRTISDYGSSDVLPVKAHGTMIYVARGGEDLRTFGVGPDQSIDSQDLTVVARHIADRGLAQLAWLAQPENTLWCVLGDGGLAAFTYHAEMNVKGWTRQELADGDWTAERVVTMPVAGGRDAAWLIVHRMKDGVPQRRIWVSSRRKDGLRLDGAKVYRGEPVNAVSGADLWEGETVTAMAGPGDGTYAEYAGLTVGEGGVVTLPDEAEAAEIIVGRPYLSRFESLPLDLAGPGSTQGRRQRLTKGWITVSGVEMQIGANEGALDVIRVPRAVGELSSLVAKRHTQSVAFGGGASRDPRIVAQTRSGSDMVIYAIGPQVDANG